MSQTASPPHPSWQHGVFMRVHSAGILICGEAGSGKSSLALALLELGHALVADDIVEWRRQGSEIIGSATQQNTGLLHSRTLGFINVTHCYGAQQTIHQHRLDGVIRITQHTPTLTPASLLQPLAEIQILGRAFPSVSLSPSQPHSAALAAAFARICTHGSGAKTRTTQPTSVG